MDASKKVEQVTGQLKIPPQLRDFLDQASTPAGFVNAKSAIQNNLDIFEPIKPSA